MITHTYSSRTFNRDVGAAMRAADAGPVFITDRGLPAFALLKIEDYFRLAGQQEASNDGCHGCDSRLSEHGVRATATVGGVPCCRI